MATSGWRKVAAVANHLTMEYLSREDMKFPSKEALNEFYEAVHGSLPNLTYTLDDFYELQRHVKGAVRLDENEMDRINHYMSEKYPFVRKIMSAQAHRFDTSEDGPMLILNRSEEPLGMTLSEKGSPPFDPKWAPPETETVVIEMGTVQSTKPLIQGWDVLDDELKRTYPNTHPDNDTLNQNIGIHEPDATPSTYRGTTRPRRKSRKSRKKRYSRRKRKSHSPSTVFSRSRRSVSTRRSDK